MARRSRLDRSPPRHRAQSETVVTACLLP
jgi:hypothetical protein